MYSGWTYPWQLNRKLAANEKSSTLPYKSQLGVESDDRGASTAFNSTFVEFVGRRFRLRGWLMTLMTSLISLGLLALPFVLFLTMPLNNANIVGLTITCGVVIIGSVILWRFILGRDFFTRTYYPIRFNRKTRQVYVFRDERDGGVLTMPWDEGFFHIGQGLRDKRLLDLRCHVLDGEIVKDTFVTGMYYLQKEQVQQLWESVIVNIVVRFLTLQSIAIRRSFWDLGLG